MRKDRLLNGLALIVPHSIIHTITIDFVQKLATLTRCTILFAEELLSKNLELMFKHYLMPPGFRITQYILRSGVLEVATDQLQCEDVLQMTVRERTFPTLTKDLSSI